MPARPPRRGTDGPGWIDGVLLLFLIVALVWATFSLAW